jgi:hypothetical protein
MMVIIIIMNARCVITIIAMNVVLSANMSVMNVTMMIANLNVRNAITAFVISNVIVTVAEFIKLKASQSVVAIKYNTKNVAYEIIGNKDSSIGLMKYRF